MFKFIENYECIEILSDSDVSFYEHVLLAIFLLWSCFRMFTTNTSCLLCRYLQGLLKIIFKW